MSPALANFVFEAANFLLLAAALGWILFKPVRRALDVERDRHAKAEEDIGRRREEAESSLREARAKRDAAEKEAAARREEILGAARKEAARVVEEARKAHAAERRAFDEELQSERAAEIAAMVETVGKIAGESVSRLLRSLDASQLDVALVRAACSELGALPSAARSSALVESARALDGEARELLEGTLGVGFDERVVSALGAGVRVTTPAGQVDATMLSVAREAAHAVTAAIASQTATRAATAAPSAGVVDG